MIYLFKSLEQFWYLPAKVCAHCERLCRQLRCTWAATRCAEVRGACTNFVSRPLSSYSVIVSLLAIGVLRCAARALAEPSLAGCEPPEGEGRAFGIRRWLGAKAGFACLDLCFAPYLQHRVWQQLVKDAMLTASTPRMARLSAAQVRESITEVFMNDLAVCLFVLASVVSFALDYVGLRWIVQGRGCDGGGYPLWVVWLGFGVFLTSVLYSVASLRADCTACGEEGDEWGRCEPRPRAPRRPAERRDGASRPRLEPPPLVQMHAWDLGAAEAQAPAVELMEA